MYSGQDIRIETLDLDSPTDERELQEILGDGWEPFAVVSGRKRIREIWFKRLTLTDD